MMEFKGRCGGKSTGKGMRTRMIRQRKEGAPEAQTKTMEEPGEKENTTGQFPNSRSHEDVP